MVFGSGYGVTQMVPMYESVTLSKFAKKEKWGGAELTDYMKKVVEEREGRGVMGEREVEERVKHYYCYTAMDYEEAMGRKCELKIGDDFSV